MDCCLARADSLGDPPSDPDISDISLESDSGLVTLMLFPESGLIGDECCKFLMFFAACLSAFLFACAVFLPMLQKRQGVASYGSIGGEGRFIVLTHFGVVNCYSCTIDSTYYLPLASIYM